METDTGGIYMAGGRYFASQQSARASRRGRVKDQNVTITEVVTAIERVLPFGEENRHDPEVVEAGVQDVERRLNNAVRLRDGEGGRGSRGSTLRELFGDDPDYEYGPRADDVTILRPPGSVKTAGLHLTEGVPVAFTPAFLVAAQRYVTHRDMTSALRAGLRFGAEVTRDYLNEDLGQRVGRFAVPAMEHVPGVADVRTAATLLNTHTYAAAHVFLRDDELAKNLVYGVLRTSFAGIRESFWDEVQEFLEAGRDRIRTRLKTDLRKRLASAIRRYEQRRRASNEQPLDLFDYTLNDKTMTVGDYADNMLLPLSRTRVLVEQYDAMNVRTDFRSTDDNRGALAIDLAVLEMREVGPPGPSLRAEMRTARAFAELARRFYAWAERVDRNIRTAEGRAFNEGLAEAVRAVSAHNPSGGDMVTTVRDLLDSIARRTPHVVVDPIFRGNVTSNLQADAVVALRDLIRYADAEAARGVRHALAAIRNALVDERNAGPVRAGRRDLDHVRRRVDQVIEDLRAYEHRHTPGPSGTQTRRRRFGGLRGGSPDHDRNPLSEQWPIGRRLTVMAPRFGDPGDLTEVSLDEVPVVGESSGAPFAYERPHPSRSTPYTYEIDRTGVVRLSGEELSPFGWTRFGDDFVHEPTGAYLRGDNGWLGRVGNHDTLLEALTSLDPGARPYRLVVDENAVYLVPLEERGTAVRIPLKDGAAGAGRDQWRNEPADDRPVTDLMLPAQASDEHAPAVRPAVEVTEPQVPEPVEPVVEVTEPRVPEPVSPEDARSGTLTGQTAADDELYAAYRTFWEALEDSGDTEARGSDATPLAPWYVERGGLGDGSVSSVAEVVDGSLPGGRPDESVTRWIDGVTSGLSSSVARAVRKKILALLAEKDPVRWERLLLHGKLIVEKDARVRLSFSVEQTEFAPPEDAGTDPGHQTFFSKYGDTTYAEEVMRQALSGRSAQVEPILFLSVGLQAGLSHVSPVFKVGTERGHGSWHTILMEVQSGNRVIANATHGHAARIRVRATVNRVERPDLLLSGRARLAFPTVYSSAAETAALAVPSGDGGHPVVRVVDPAVLDGLDHAVTAIVPEALLAGLRSVLDHLGLPAKDVDEIVQDVAEEYVNEKTFKDRSQWWLTGSWVTGLIAKRLSALSTFQGHLEVSGRPHTVRYVTTTEKEVLLRNDIADTVRIGDGQKHSSGASATPGVAFGIELGSHLATPSVDLPKLGSSREHGRTLTSGGQVKNATMRKDRLVRYQTEFVVTVSVKSDRGDVPFTLPVIGELGIGLAHAEKFERGALGGVLTGSGLIPAEAPKKSGNQEDLEAPAGSTALDEGLPAETEALEEDAPVRSEVPAEPETLEPETVADGTLAAPEPAAGRSAPSWADFARWLRSRFTDGGPPAPFLGDGVRDVGDLIALASRGPIEIVLPPTLHDALVPHWLVAEDGWRTLYAHPGITWVLPTDEHAFLVSGEDSGASGGAVWRYVLDENARVVGALLMDEHEGEREPRWYVPNPAREPMTAEAPSPWHEDLLSPLRAAELTALTDFLASGGIPQVQLTEALRSRLAEPGGDRTLHDAVDALMAEPRIQVVAADGRRVEEQEGGEKAGEKRFVIDERGQVHGPLRTWRHVVHPREPLALAARTGLGRGIVREMPGREKAYRELVDELARQMRTAGVVGEMSAALRQHLARALAMKFGVPGARGTMADGIDGDISHELTIGGYKFTAVLYTELRALRRDPVAETDVSLDTQRKNVAGLDTEDKKGRTIGAGFKLSFRIKLARLFSLDLHLLELKAERARHHKIGNSTGVKEYRRERTNGNVTRFEYATAYTSAVTTSRTSGDLVAARVWEQSGDEYWTAVTVSDAHLPAKPLPADEILAYGEVTVKTGPMDEEGLRRLAAPLGKDRGEEFDLSREGLTGIQLNLTGVSEISAHMAELVAAHNKAPGPRPQADAFKQVLAALVPSGRRYGAVERILRTGTHTFLESNARRLLSRRGLRIPLPSTAGGWRQELRIRMRTFNVRHEQTVKGATLEQYTEADLRFGEERAANYGLDGSAGPGGVVRLGLPSAESHNEGEGHQTTSQKVGNQISGGAMGGGDVSFPSRSVTDMGGALDLNLGTYSGDSEQLGADPVYTIQYRRWRSVSGSRKLRRAFIRGRGTRVSYRVERHVKITRGTELLVPYVRAADHGLPVPAREDLPSATGERHYLGDDLALAAAHIEDVDAADVVDTIEAMLGGDLDPDVLGAIETAFDEEAIRGQYKIARRGGIHRVLTTPAQTWAEGRVWDYLKMPARNGGTLHTGIRVTAIEDSIAYRRPRPDVKVTTGGQAFVQIGEHRSRGHAWRGGGFFHGRWATAPLGLRPAGGVSVKYERRHGLKVGVESTARDVRRATAKDTSQEFRHGGRFRVEVFHRYSPSEFSRRTAQVAKAVPTLVDILSLGESRRMWWRLFPTTTPAAATREVPGRATVLVPTHLTAAGPRPSSTSAGQASASAAASVSAPVRPMITRTPPPAPTALATSLAEHVHAMAMPGIEHLARWAPAAATPRRRIDGAAVARGVAPTVEEFGPTHQDGLTGDIGLDERDASANVDKLLRGTYRIPLVGGEYLTVQMVPGRGRWLTRGGFTGLNFPEHSQEPAREHEAERGWSVDGEFDLGHTFARPLEEHADQPMIDPGISAGRDNRIARSHKNSAGDYVESNRQRDDDYDYYTFDARFHVSGPHGHYVVLDVPDGFIGMLPATVVRRLITDLGLDLERPPLGDTDLPAQWAENGTLPPEATAAIIDRAGGMAVLRGRTLRLWTRADHLASAAAAADRITAQTGVPVELLTSDADGTISRYPRSARQASRPATTPAGEPDDAIKPPHDRLAGLTDEDLPASAPLIDEDRQVSLADLERAGIDLTTAQRSQAILNGGLRGADLTRVQRFQLAAKTEPVAPETSAATAEPVTPEVPAETTESVAPEASAETAGALVPVRADDLAGVVKAVPAPPASRPQWREIRSADGREVGQAYFAEDDWRLRSPFYGGLQDADFRSWSGAPGREVSAPVEVPVGDRDGVYLLAWHGSQPPPDTAGVVATTAREIISRGFTTLFLLPCTDAGVTPSPELGRVAREHGLTIIEGTGGIAPTPGVIDLLPDAAGRAVPVRRYRPDGGVDHYGPAPERIAEPLPKASPGGEAVDAPGSEVPEEPGGDLAELPVVPQEGEAFGRALARALDRGASLLRTGDETSTPGGPSAAMGSPFDRLMAGLTEESLPASAPLFGADGHVRVQDLENAGASLTAAQHTQAVLQDGALPVASLTRVQRFRLAMEDPLADHETRAGLLAVVDSAARTLGVRLALAETPQPPGPPALPDPVFHNASTVTGTGAGRLTAVVERPEFQDVNEDPESVPDGYGRPLQYADGTRVPLFDGQPTRLQAYQGGLDDCQLVTLIGAVAARYPGVIGGRVRETQDGNYQVSLNEAEYVEEDDLYRPTGRLITLTVTPDLPVFADDPGTPAFARGAGTAWAPILEKAFAGIDQTWSAERWQRWIDGWTAMGGDEEAVPRGYVRLHQGNLQEEGAEMLTQLTGLRSSFLEIPGFFEPPGPEADQRLIDGFRTLLGENKPIVVGTRSPEEEGGDQLLAAGLLEGHYYDVVLVDDEGFIHLYNPWNRLHPPPLTAQGFRSAFSGFYITWLGS
ncbi:hypothetical protein GCM10029978_061800 [Actinoallomurus acanthiterrae]